MASYFRQTHYQAFGSLSETVRTGEPAATLFLGKPFFDWINENPDLAKLQNEAMAGFTQNARGDLLDVYDLPDGHSATAAPGLCTLITSKTRPRPGQGSARTAAGL